MGSRGPVPKRSDQRVRRNKDSAVETIPAIGPVEVPDLGIPDAHPLIADFYESLKDSAQTQFYEPSDWQFARFTMHFANQLVKSRKPSSQMLAAVNAALTELLVSEGARRRVRLEVEREQSAGQLIDVAEMFRQQLQQPAAGG